MPDKPRTCNHKCHDKATRLNPWVEVCPICGCLNEHFDGSKPPTTIDELMQRIGGGE